MNGDRHLQLMTFSSSPSSLSRGVPPFKQASLATVVVAVVVVAVVVSAVSVVGAVVVAVVGISVVVIAEVVVASTDFSETNNPSFCSWHARVHVHVYRMYAQVYLYSIHVHVHVQYISVNSLANEKRSSATTSPSSVSKPQVPLLVTSLPSNVAPSKLTPTHAPARLHLATHCKNDGACVTSLSTVDDVIL